MYLQETKNIPLMHNQILYCSSLQIFAILLLVSAFTVLNTS